MTSSPARRRRTKLKVAPPPGSTPRIEPSAVPRSTAGHDAPEVVQRRPQPRDLGDTTERCSSGCARLAMISPTPNTPMASVATSMPSVSSRMPKVKRVPPVLPSVPTSPISSPSTIMATALTIEPCASTTAAIKSEHHQREILRRAERLANSRQRRRERRRSGRSRCSRRRTSRAPRSPAPRRRGPARAIWWPSMQVTTEEVSPGRLTRMAVVEPPYCAP